MKFLISPKLLKKSCNFRRTWLISSLAALLLPGLLVGYFSLPFLTPDPIFWLMVSQYMIAFAPSAVIGAYTFMLMLELMPRAKHKFAKSNLFIFSLCFAFLAPIVRIGYLCLAADPPQPFVLNSLVVMQGLAGFLGAFCAYLANYLQHQSLTHQVAKKLL